MFDKPAPELLIAAARQALEAGVEQGFPQKVVANALGIAERELTRGPSLNAAEHARLQQLLGEDGDVAALNNRLAAAIRGRAIATDQAQLIEHLILTTVAKLEVDQPAYPAFRAWRERP